ncbi:MAG: EamA family transporter [Candidatus Diapherotrites archaeon]|uniref:EamA family transporter n=1 Tax=Candidatus Iainarchaeum sp. TaxID=3101447 RepID=A0A8T4LBD7_9ARCH|nr:EamA family transporter [Candidatus Diapherotrites archaeon]
MLGLLFALASGVFETLVWVQLKGAQKRGTPLPVLFGVGTLLYALMSLALLPFADLSKLTPTMWMLSAVSAAINVIGWYFMLKAIERLEVSILGSFAGVYTVFAVLAGALTLGEWPSPLGWAGILLVFFGLQLVDRFKLVTDRRQLWKNPGVQVRLAAIAAWVIEVYFVKEGVVLAGPVNFHLLRNGFLLLFALPLMYALDARAFRRFAGKPWLWGQAAVWAFSRNAQIFTSLVAISLTFVGYASAVMNTNILWTLALGHFMLGEKRVREKLVACGVITLGAVLVSLA